MADTKWTKGPWQFDDGCQIVESERPHMRIAFLPSDHAQYASSKPNAHLIAAAPDLYEALEDCETIMMIVMPRSNTADYVAALKQARTALRKARGEPS